VAGVTAVGVPVAVAVGAPAAVSAVAAAASVVATAALAAADLALGATASRRSDSKPSSDVCPPLSRAMQLAHCGALHTGV
jgi:hypothetical protein